MCPRDSLSSTLHESPSRAASLEEYWEMEHNVITISTTISICNALIVHKSFKILMEFLLAYSL